MNELKGLGKKGKNKAWKKWTKHELPRSRATSVSFFERGWILVYIFCLVIIIISRRDKMKFLNMERAYEPFQLSLTIWAPSIDNKQFPRNSLFKTPKFTGNAGARGCFACKWFCSFFFYLWPISLWLIARSRNLNKLHNSTSSFHFWTWLVYTATSWSIDHSNQFVLFGIQSQVLQSSTTKVVEYFILPCSLHSSSHFYVLRSSDRVDKPKAHVKCNLFVSWVSLSNLVGILQ